MFQSNYKFNNNNGIEFSEQNVLLDDQVYYENIKIIAEVEYITPGFGFALINGHSTTDFSECYIFKFSTSTASIIYKDQKASRIIKSIPFRYDNLISNPDPISVTFEKVTSDDDRYSYVVLSIDGNEIITDVDFMFDDNIDAYMVGIYSNAGNIVKNIKYYMPTPKYWTANLNNTQFGNIVFSNDSFTLSSTDSSIQVEQYDIKLDSNTDYYLQYEFNDNNDITCYAFVISGNGTIDELSNILDGNKIHITSENNDKVNICLRFSGTHGTVSNIVLSQKEDAPYAATVDGTTTINASSVMINTEGIDKITWSAAIRSLGDSYATVKSGDNVIKVEDKSVDNYTLNIDDNIATLSYNGKEAKLAIYDNTISIMCDMDATINSINLCRGTEEITMVPYAPCKLSVPLARTAPIIVAYIDYETGKYVPLDISSSYRIENGKYIFTNAEREQFAPSIKLYINNAISKKVSPTIYALKKEYDILDIQDIYHNDISSIVDESGNSKLVQLSKDSYEVEDSIIVLNTAICNPYDYQCIIVDYLKDDSYCVNANFDTNTYDIEISSERDCVLMYGNSNAPDESIRLTEEQVYTIKHSMDGAYVYMVQNDTLNCAHIKTHTETIDEIPATCVIAGSETVITICDKCGKTINIGTTEIPATGHSEETLAAVAPTCIETGLTKGKKCTVCGEITVKQEVVPATGHNYTAVKTEATCTQGGYTTYTCVCGNTYVADKTTRLEHNYVNGFCERCNIEEIVKCDTCTPAEAVKEKITVPTCTKTGSYDDVIYCSVCNAEIERETVEVPMLGHTEGEVVVENEVTADCVNAGSYDNVVYCTVCDAEISRETITVEPNDDNHTWNEEILVGSEVAATCTQAGSYDRLIYCSVCGYENGRHHTTVDALGHSYDDNGICTRCGFEGYSFTATLDKKQYVAGVDNSFKITFSSGKPLSNIISCSGAFTSNIHNIFEIETIEANIGESIEELRPITLSNGIEWEFSWTAEDGAPTTANTANFLSITCKIPENIDSGKYEVGLGIISTQDVTTSDYIIDYDIITTLTIVSSDVASTAESEATE